LPVSAYDRHYRARVRRLQQGQGVLCAHCKRERATTLDHDPPLAMHKHRQGGDCCRLIPSCERCNREGGGLVATGRWRPGVDVVGLEIEPERQGLGQGDRRWAVPWLKGLRRPPPDATWPRLMTVPHPRAVGSLGPAFIREAEARTGRTLRWWQRLVATRLLEIDGDGRLVWETLVLSMARQLGKSWLLRELCLWRIQQGERFGEPQDVMHTGKDLAICKEVQRPARLWAKARADRFKVREVNGQEEIELLADGSRWMLRAKEAVYGYAVSVAAADEAWKIKPSSIEEGLVPTMAEREQAQLWLVSTAHRMATGLVLQRRQVALADLEGGDGDLLIEWSAPQGAELDDMKAWRQASPHWTAQRQRRIQKQLDAIRTGGEHDDPDEPDPVESFRAQWLNQWPQRTTSPGGPTEPVLPAGVWEELAEPGLVSDGPIWVAVEDDYGLGAAVAACARLPDGRLEVDGWLCPDWDSALAAVQALAAVRRVRQLQVGASMIDRVPAGMTGKPAGTRETRVGLALFRDMAVNGQLAHDTQTTELDQALDTCQVKEAPTGLFLIGRGPTHLIKATVWAVSAAHRPTPMPAIR
jgi:hypothetical protein